MIKILKRKVSRTQIDFKEHGSGPDSASLSKSPPTTQQLRYQQQHLPLQYGYQRPYLLGEFTAEEKRQNVSHYDRHVLTPKRPLLASVGYAEAINAGKSKVNEDQAALIEGCLDDRASNTRIPYIFAGIFDGHGGHACAIKVANELHSILQEGLDDVLPQLVNAIEEAKQTEPRDSGGTERRRSDDEGDLLLEEEEDKEDKSATLERWDDFEEDETKEVDMSLDELIVGAIESSYWAMDRLILKDKETHRILGGSTCLVALFICGKLYMANAGDSRAVACIQQEGKPKPMSFDFTPSNDRQRIQHIAFQRPELLRHPTTKERLYNRHILSRKVSAEDVGHPVMYRDFYMTGWSCRDVTQDDVNLVPIISGRGKVCRLLATVGVARGLGDHDLIAKGSGVRCKEFLTCQPDVRILPLEELDELSDEDCVVMASDGLWDVLSNKDVYRLVQKKTSNKPFTFTEVAKALVRTSRGERMPEMYWEMPGEFGNRLASGDDITAMVLPLKKCLRRVESID